MIADFSDIYCKYISSLLHSLNSLAACFWFGFTFLVAFSLSGDGRRQGPPLDGLIPAPLSGINVSGVVLEFLLATFPLEKSCVNVFP